MAAMDLPPSPSHEAPADLGCALPHGIRRPALLVLEPASLRPRLVLLRHHGGGRLARGAVRVHDLRRRVRPAVDGRRARRGGAGHAGYVDHRAGAAGVRREAQEVARRGGAARHAGHRGARVPRAAARGQRCRRALRRGQLRRPPPRSP
jgi:hypothetical protein